MADMEQTSRRLAEELKSGDHRLDNASLRSVFGVSRISALKRRQITASLESAGLAVVSGRGDEPLVVRKIQPQHQPIVRGAEPPTPRRAVPWYRRRWVKAAAVVLAFLIVVSALTQPDGDDRARRVATTETQPATETAPVQSGATTPVEPTQTLEDAADLVDEDEYGRAVAIAAVLGAAEANRIRRKISRRLAQRTLRALASGDRSRAGFLLASAARYPRTPQIASARISYTAARQRASSRATAQRNARAEAREATRQRRARRAADAEASEQREQGARATQPSAPSGPVCESGSTTNFCGKRDGDGDGCFCEGE